ncbi:hypothetical protein DICPUDRAFT_89252 [Dictyostelium purpureum]|uniref:Uncharacterized protein n=1 Tax=Dictyostelium purpureum TaxID=5786 RepID=F0ZUL2_DICPU|nr:uncharacterized protein DICPUDRAFT_89252 [Dictyostelium purpureum]EGC32369.1 hypothetical protein DICPUDRAFT_89252 [Dictyostelium purpureum]|eukprot:XP_003291099.1 hypothetical protein DICPUDRAFT_89252 [Dictyostelium purpureum]
MENNNNNNNENSYNNDISESKVIQFGEIKDEYDQAKLAIVRDFPMCFYPISKLFDCERDNQVPPSSSATSKFKICQHENAHLNFCILSSFCPFEATLLMNCTNGHIPVGETIKIPKKCLEIFNSFDNCLTRKTKEFETRGFPETEERTRVVYGDNITPNKNKNSNDGTTQ